MTTTLVCFVDEFVVDIDVTIDDDSGQRRIGQRRVADVVVVADVVGVDVIADRRRRRATGDGCVTGNDDSGGGGGIFFGVDVSATDDAKFWLALRLVLRLQLSSELQRRLHLLALELLQGQQLGFVAGIEIGVTADFSADIVCTVFFL